MNLPLRSYAPLLHSSAFFRSTPPPRISFQLKFFFGLIIRVKGLTQQ